MSNTVLKLVQGAHVITDENLSPIESINSIRTAHPIKHDRPEVREVRPEELHIEEAFQRHVSHAGKALIRDMVESWDWAKFSMPAAYVTPSGRLVLFDGQHTAIAAASHQEIETIPVAVYHSIASIRAAAEAFVGRNTDRLVVHMLQRYKAALVAEADWAVKIFQLSEQVGFNVPFYPDANPPADTVLAIKTLSDGIDEFGFDAVKKTMRILVGNNFAPIRDMHIKAVTRLTFERQYRGIRADYLKGLLRSVDNNKLVAQSISEAALSGLTRWESMALILFKMYREKYGDLKN
jgi:hypothetical protein